MTTKEFLIKSRNRLRGHWTKHTLGAWTSEEGSVCAVGSMIASIDSIEHQDTRNGGAAVNNLLQNPCYDELLAIAKQIDNPEIAIALRTNGRKSFLRALAAFNDDPFTTEQDVLNLFDEMIRKA